jgi:hypothetical protein
MSALILGWAFTLPFRKPGRSLVSSTTSDGNAPQLELSERIKQRRTSAEEFRKTAIALDREFMRSLAKKREAKADVPGKREVKAHWKRHVKLVKKQLEQLKDAEEGSLERQHRESLVESLQDGPP